MIYSFDCAPTSNLHLPVNKQKQVSAVTDEPAWQPASQQTYCKQRWTLSVINLRLN